MSEEELKITVQPVAHRIWRCTAPNAMCSCVIFAGERAVLVADSMLTPGLARQVKTAVCEIAGRPTRYLLNTHGDSDHVFGNQVFSPETIILAHHLTRERLITNGERELQAAKTRRPQLATEFDQVHIVPPDLAFDGSLEIDLGNLTLHCLYLGPAHTPGDVAVWAPQQRFLFPGDIVFNHIFPVMRNADPDGWLQALNRLEKLDPEVVAPGHGEVGDKTTIREMTQLITTLRDTVRNAKMKALTLQQTLDTISLPDYQTLPRAEDRLPEAIQRLYTLA